MNYEPCIILALIGYVIWLKVHTKERHRAYRKQKDSDNSERARYRIDIEKQKNDIKLQLGEYEIAFKMFAKAAFGEDATKKTFGDMLEWIALRNLPQRIMEDVKLPEGAISGIRYVNENGKPKESKCP